ncbi:MAG: hypothetical protein WDA09_00935 [Bacteriovoracaceae bacterium]
MEISYKEYRMVPSENAPGKFDLNEIVERKTKGTGQLYQSFNNHGYGMSLERCMIYIITLELNKKKSVVSIGEYIKEFKEERDVIISEIKNQTKIKQNA